MVMICMLFAGVEAASAATVTENFLTDSETIKIVSVEEQHEIIDGVYEATIILKNTKTGNENIKTHVLLVKPYAKASFKPVIPGYYTKVPGGTAEDRRAMEWGDSDFREGGVTSMVKEYQSAGDAKPVLAAFNGSFSNKKGAPESRVIIDGVERYHSKHIDQFIFGHKTASGVMNIVQSAQGQDSAFDEAITGNFYFLRNGTVCNLVEADADGNGEPDHRQRHGVGIRLNGDILIITTEGGMLVEQFAQLFDSSGCYNAINLDGGGSINFQTDRGDGKGLVRRTLSNAEMGYDHDAYNDRLIPDAFMLVAEEETVANNVGEVTDKISLSSDTYYYGDPIMVTASSLKESTWVGLFDATTDVTAKKDNKYPGSYVWYNVYGGNGNDGTAGTWCWDQGATIDLFKEAEINGSYVSSLELEPGKYKVSLINEENGIRTELAKDEFTISKDPSIPVYDKYTVETDKDVYEVGKPIYTTATVPNGASSAWVGLYDHNKNAGTNNPSYYWHYVDIVNGKSIAINTGSGRLKEGLYDIRVFKDGGYTVASQDGKSVQKTIAVVNPNSEYSIKYKDGSKNITGLSPSKYTYKASKAASIMLPGTVQKEGHNFLGWYENEDLSGQAITAIPQGSYFEKTYYAKFEKLKYGVKFDTDGAGTIESQTVEYGGFATEPSNPNKGEEYKFVGWVTEKDGSVPFDFKNMPITGETTIYAKWQFQGDYDIVFDTDGGSTVLPQSINAGEKATKPENPTKHGYTFDKWVTEKNGTEEYDFDAVVTSSTTIYAKWNIITYSITFDSAGGEAVPSVEYTVEDAITLPSITKDGYEFIGWKDAEGKAYTEVAKGTYGDLELIAHWKRIESLKVNKKEYVQGAAIKVNAYTEKSNAWVGLYREGDIIGDGASSPSYYWTEINYNGKDYNGKEFNLLDYKKASKELVPGNYNVILFHDNGSNAYTEIMRESITIVENNNPVKGTLTLAGASRTDKQYTGSPNGRADFEGNWPNYYYGDGIFAKAEVSGDGAEDSTVRIVDDARYLVEDYSAVGTNWYYTGDFEGKEVNLNYVSESVVQNTPNFAAKGYRWVVLVNGAGELIDSKPIFIRTYNMNWLEGEGTWGDQVKNNIRIETEWISKVANGEDQKPAVTIKRVNGHYGYSEDGKEITEHILTEGKDYTLKYPDVSKGPGTYNIKVEFPTVDAEDVNYLNDSSKAKYYGLANGISYHITESDKEKTVTYELNGGVNNANNPGVYKVGSEIKFASPTREGYIFGGWYTSPDFEEGTWIEGISKDEDNDITVYAKWTSEEAAQYTIKYVLNGGVHTVESFPIRYTGEADLNIPPVTRQGYTFAGWFYDKGFTKSADVIKKGTKGNLTLYAKFVKNTFKVSTAVEGGTITKTTDVKNGSSFTVTYAPEEGYMLQFITVDGQDVDINAYPTSYTFDSVNSNHDILVIFEEIELLAPSKVTLQLSTAKNGYDNVKVSWGKVMNADGYKLYYKRSSASKWTTKTVEGNETYTTGNLSDGYKYTFRVVPYIKSGDSIIEAGEYKSSTITTLKKVTNVKLSRSGSKVKVRWTNIGGESGYQISKASKKSKTNVVSTYKTTKGKSKLVKATKGKKYYYKVRAYKTVDGKKVYGPWSTAKAYRR